MNDMKRREIVKEQVHKAPGEKKIYNSTKICDSTNCYSYAIGATHPYLALYRIGAISGKKSIEENYISIAEIIELVLLDLDFLELNYEALTQMPDIMPDDSYVIQLYVKIYGNGMIGDFHFIRYENGLWSEKYRGQKPRALTEGELDRYQNDPMYKKILMLKITR